MTCLFFGCGYQTEEDGLCTVHLEYLLDLIEENEEDDLEAIGYQNAA